MSSSAERRRREGVERFVDKVKVVGKREKDLGLGGRTCNGS